MAVKKKYMKKEKLPESHAFIKWWIPAALNLKQRHLISIQLLRTLYMVKKTDQVSCMMKVNFLKKRISQGLILMVLQKEKHRQKVKSLFWEAGLIVSGRVLNSIIVVCMVCW